MHPACDDSILRLKNSIASKRSRVLSNVAEHRRKSTIDAVDGNGLSS